MKKFVLAAMLICGMSSCDVTQSLYSWHNYEEATYQYSKKQTDELKAKTLEEYQKMIETQKGSRGVVPPGLYAEYGYLLYKNGKKEEGLKLLKQEIALYPESETYISRIVKQLEK